MANSDVARLPVPDRGQPLDVAYIYRMVSSINNLAEQIDSSTEKRTRIVTKDDSQPQDARTSDVKFFASFQQIYSQVEVRQGETKDFSFQISGFKFPPIATVTPVNTETTSASNDATTVITSITNSEIRGFVRFNSSGQVNTGVNVIAIGIPD
jgi:hypothetical protein